MSILIKDMEMPTDGEAVVLVISNENGKTLAEVDEYCGAVYEAVPVPPHGDLKDTDAMIKELAIDDLDDHNGATLLMAVFLEVLKAAPTIIPKSGGAE